jgi:hypothetical protein
VRGVVGVIDVRSEAEGSSGSIGCTSLVRVPGEVMVNYSLRNWLERPRDPVIWELSDPVTRAAWVGRGGGEGGSPEDNGRWTYEGGWWFAARRAPRVELSARRGDETLLLTDIELHLVPPTVAVEVLDVTGDLLPEGWQTIVERVSGFQSGRPVADFVAAVTPSPSHVRNLEITPIALESWGDVLRLVVHVAGPRFKAPHAEATWWRVRIGGREPQWACKQQLGGGLAHLLLPEQLPGEPFTTSPAAAPTLGGDPSLN